MFKVSRVMRVNHGPIATRLAEIWVCFEECTIAALQQVALGIQQRRVAIAVTVSILVAQKSHPAHDKTIISL